MIHKHIADVARFGLQPAKLSNFWVIHVRHKADEGEAKHEKNVQTDDREDGLPPSHVHYVAMSLWKCPS